MVHLIQPTIGHSDHFVSNNAIRESNNVSLLPLKTANQLLNTSIRRTNRKDAGLYPCQSSHLGSHVDVLRKLFSTNLFFPPSATVYRNLLQAASWMIHLNSPKLTPTSGFSMALTQAVDSIVQGRTVSVLPSRYSLVMDASYVKLNFPLSWNKRKRKRAMQCIFTEKLFTNSPLNYGNEFRTSKKLNEVHLHDNKPVEEPSECTHLDWHGTFSWSLFRTLCAREYVNRDHSTTRMLPKNKMFDVIIRFCTMWISTNRKIRSTW